MRVFFCIGLSTLPEPKNTPPRHPTALKTTLKLNLEVTRFRKINKSKTYPKHKYLLRFIHIHTSASSVISIPEALKNSVRTRSANLVTKLHAKSTKTMKKCVAPGAQNRQKIDKNRYVDSKVSFWASPGPPGAATWSQNSAPGSQNGASGPPKWQLWVSQNYKNWMTTKQ